MLTLLAGALLLWLQAPTPKPDIGHEIALDLQAGKNAEAKELVRRALKQSPKDARLWTLGGLTLVQLNETAAARASFNRALDLAPNYLPALEGAAHLEFQDNPNRAAILANRILKLRPDDELSHFMLAAIAFKQGDCDAGKKEESKMAHGFEIATLRNFGPCLVNGKRFAEAVPVYQRLVDLQPRSEDAIYSLGVVQFLTGKFSEAIRTITAISEMNPPNAEALELIGEAYEFTGDSDRAMTYIERAIAADPRTPSYYADFGYLCLAHGKFQKGVDVLTAGLPTVPDPAPLYVARGLLYSELGKFEEGENDFQHASRLDPNVELGSAAQGLAELQQNDLPRAESTTRERLRLHPNDAFLNYLLAEVLARRGAATDAIPPAEKAVKLKPDLIVARNLLARLYLQVGRTNESIEQSRVVYEANPADQTALYHLILALRKGSQTEEIPALLKQLARLKEESRGKDDFEQKQQLLKP